MTRHLALAFALIATSAAIAEEKTVKTTTVNADGSTVRLQDAVDDVHQGRLARAILTSKCVDFTRLQLKLAAAQSVDGAKGLGDIGQLQKGRAFFSHLSVRCRVAPPMSRRGEGPQLRPSM
jgi:hypothetical protein